MKSIKGFSDEDDSSKFAEKDQTTAKDGSDEESTNFEIPLPLSHENCKDEMEDLKICVQDAKHND